MLRFGLGLALLTALAVPSAARAADPEYTMILATVAPADSPWSAVLTKFKKSVEEKTGGKIKIKLKLGGMLGDENEAVTKCHRGQIQAVGASTGALATHVPELHLVELPFLFKTFEEADQVIDTVLTPHYVELFKKRGLVLGFWSEKGKKMRSQESPVHLAMYKALGASAVPIPTTEVPQALATGNVDGFDQSTLYALATSWTKSIKYFTVSEHIYQPGAIVYNKAWFDGLPADMQKILIDEGKGLEAKGRKAVREIVPELYEIMKKDGIEIYMMTDAEKEPFAKASRKVYDQFKKDQGKEAAGMLDDSLAKLKKIRGQ
jgi:TRAP-type C4-dicarboxylate transport system substrate-binding protein